MIDSHKKVPAFFKPAVVRYSTAALLAFALSPTIAHGQFTANSLAELRTYGTTVNNSTVTLSATGGDPHPVTGIVTPGHYWINGDHIADPTNSMPIFMDLGGTGNTYNLSGATINLDTRKLDGFGRNLGHDSGVDIIQITGSNNTVQGITLIGQDIALDTDPNAQRYADWATQYIELSGDNNTVDGAHVVTRGSRTDSYGLSDAFGKGASQGISPFIGHRKASAFRVGEATNAVINDMHLEVNTFGHGFFVQESTNTTLTNSTVTGELFSSQLVVDRPEYQEYGHTWWGQPIPDDIMLSGAEGGVRVYSGSSGLTVDNVVVDGMRTGFATVHDGGDVVLNNVFAYNTTSGFDVGDNTTITNSGGNIVNGPLLVFYGDGDNVDIDLELTEGTPIGTNWTAAYFGGNADISITSDLEAGDLPQESYIRLGQSYFENWRDFDFNTATPEDEGRYPQYYNNQTFINDTQQIVFIGENVEGNVGRSLGGVISNGKENHYDGVTYVFDGARLEVTHDEGLGNGGAELGAEFDNGGNVVYTGTATEATFDDNATIVQDGATLEVAPLVQIKDERIYITGNGVDGKGAIYTDGSNDNKTRIVNSVGSDELIILAGDASIGVGDADGMLLVSRLAGTGNLTKLGAGTISVEKFSSFDGDFIVAEGHVVGRRGTFNNNIEVHNGASIGAIAGYMLESYDGQLHLDGTLDMNSRTDDNTIDGVIGTLNGGINGVVTSSNPFAGAGGTLEIAGATDDGQYFGTFEGAVNIIKSGSNTQAFDGTLTHTGTTSVTGGTLLINGTHTGGDAYTVSGTGTLGGDGDIQSSVIVNAGGTLSPGNSPGILTIDDLELNTGAVLDLEIGGNLGGSGYDRITADTATLGGDLNISLLDLGDGLFEPGAGDSFLTLFATTSLTGSFDNVATGERLDTEGGEGSFVVTYGGGLNYILLSSFESSASLAGDYNGDGFVSQADLDLVLLNWGAATTPGGFDESAIPGGGPFDGLMSQNELDGVLLNWGDGAVPNLSAIPEPSSVLALGVLGVIARRKAKR